MATAQQIRDYQEGNQALVKLAENDLDSVWRPLEGASADEIKPILLEVMPELIDAYGSTSALLAADFYDELRDVPMTQERFNAVMVDSVPIEQTQAMTRWAIDPLYTEAPDHLAALSLLKGGMQRLILQSGRESMFTSADRDPVSTRFFRVTTGSENCAFCVLMASRGSVYTSAESAGQMRKFHDRDDCMIVPVRKQEDIPAEFDPDKLYEKYRNVQSPGMSTEQVLSVMRAEYGMH